MANTTKFYRTANVSLAEAAAQLAKKFSDNQIENLEKRAITAEEAAESGRTAGELVYVATIRVAEFPPAEGEEKKDESSDSSDSGESKSDSDSSDSDESSDSDNSKPPFGGGEDKGAEPKKPDFQTELLHLLKMIADALGGGGLGGPGLDSGPGDLDLPDVGAPDKGESLPPVDGPGAPGGAPTKGPLPPPVKEKSPIGVGAFASIASESQAYLVREADAGNKQIIAEVEEYLPTHRVAKIQRTGSAKINGKNTVLADAGIALVTITKK